MVFLIILVGHLWTCSGCLRPPHSGSVYIEVSVSMTAMHTWYTMHSDMDIVTIMRQILTSYYTAIWGHPSLCCRPIGPGSCHVLLLKDGDFFNYIKCLLLSSPLNYMQRAENA